jgi:Chaperone of endosialidase
MNTTTRSINSVHRPLAHSVLLFVSFLIGCFAISLNMQAVNPPPDGGYGPPAYGVGNTAEGYGALFNLTSGTYNTAIGLLSLRGTTTGNFNTAVGAGTLLTNTGDENTAVGAGALLSNTTGSQNTANGESALFYNTTGNRNTATGFQALVINTTGSDNSATGFQALNNNTTGRMNTANGAQALNSNAIGNINTATGFQALFNNTAGGGNTAAGYSALSNNTTGNNNTAMGANALLSNTTGDSNVAFGENAGSEQTTGGGNVYIGRSMVGVAGETNKTYIRNINSTPLNGTAVTVNVNTGLIGRVTSSRRYKEEIQPMDQASEALYQLKPVNFRYKKEIDHAQALSFGLIAEEVAEVNPDLIVRDTVGRPETVRYDAVNAMLLNEFLKEHHKVLEQEATITQLKKEMATVVARLKEQDTKLQRVSDRIELRKPAQQTASKRLEELN